jgi:hypothetical protein
MRSNKTRLSLAALALACVPLAACGADHSPVVITGFHPFDLGEGCKVSTSDTVFISRGQVNSNMGTGFAAVVSIRNLMADDATGTGSLLTTSRFAIIDTVTTTYRVVDGSGLPVPPAEKASMTAIIPPAGNVFVAAPLLLTKTGEPLAGKAGTLLASSVFSGKLENGGTFATDAIEFPIVFFAAPPLTCADGSVAPSLCGTDSSGQLETLKCPAAAP